MEGEELQEKIEQLRQNRGGRSPAGERRSREPDFRRAYRGEREPARGAFSWQEDVSARYGAPADEKREDGLLGVFTFQGILAVTVALLYVLAAALAPEISSGALAEFRNRSENDFSFREQVYDTVGNLLSYLNEAHPVSGEMDGESLDGMGGEPALSSRELPDNATFAPLVYTGQSTFPVSGRWRITSGFGFREHPVSGEADFHLAVDIAAPQGTPVLAAAGGIVTVSEESGPLGKHLTLDHGNGFVTVYGHCDRLIAQPGARIREGEVIARVGSTGDSTGYHLHFAMQKDGLYFDPACVFPQAAEDA